MALARIDRGRLAALTERELARFRDRNVRSAELHERSRDSLVGGVPMPWMMLWAGGFPITAAAAAGSRVTDLDGHEYIDLCLGDTGAMTGHGLPALIDALRERDRRGLTLMLPTEDAPWVGEELTRRFGLDRWLFTLSATDANRAALRLCRQITGRRKVLVYSYCYHGSVDEAFAVADAGGATRSREGNVGPAVDPSETTVAVEFNDLGALEQALAERQLACVLAEPAMTNMGIILPEPGYHEALRELTRDHGTLLIIDETHTISAGPGGCTAEWGLEPDMLTLGKAIAGGIPAGALGMTAELQERMLEQPDADYLDTGGVGGTLAGNALSLAAMRATLSNALRDQDFAVTIPLAARFAAGVHRVSGERELGWSVAELGARAEYRFEPRPARNGSEAHARADAALERYLHLHALNRGLLLTPFHNMALMAPSTTEADVDRHTELLALALDDLLG